jgi:hypothetical protein
MTTINRQFWPTVFSAALFAAFSFFAGVTADAQSAALDSATSIAFYPSLRKLEVRVLNLAASAGQKAVVRVLRPGDMKEIAHGTLRIDAMRGTCMLDLPQLQEGKYEVRVSTPNSQNVVRTFKYKTFPWVDNTLGERDVLFAPFEPMRVKGNVAEVVLRSYEMNGFGLWNSVRSEGREILAAPIALHVITEKGEEEWKMGRSGWVSSSETKAVYEASAEADAVRLKTVSTIEYDGCMKVTMSLLPGRHARVIQRLWLEIPVKDTEAPLFHYTAFESMRRNYAGKTPRGGRIVWMKQPYDTDPPKWPRGALPPVWKAEPGSDDGILWTCRDIYPWKHVISTDFVPYIWIGGGARGLAFFGANDKGYIVDPKGVMQTLERKNGVLYLRVGLINKPTAIRHATELTFGLQASPTRPMPNDWRVKQKITPAMPGPVLAWGGYICANKYPEGYHWQIVDEICRVRETGVVDTSVFEELDRAREEPWKKPWGGTGAPGFDAWLARDTWYFINQARNLHDRSDWKAIASSGVYPEAVAKILSDPPWMAYTEEHASDITEPEWEVYQDEWRAEWPWTKPRNEIVGQQQPDNNFNYGDQAFTESYLDFCLYYHKLWFQRGIGVYFDNTMPFTMYNPLISDAYYDDDGQLQPACSIWEQRSYYKRVWQLMNEMQSRSPHPLAFAQHITNTRLLPWNTWNSTSLDIEWDWYRDTTQVTAPDEVSASNNWDGQGVNRRRTRLRLPVPADLLLTEAVGRQTGSMGDSHFGILGNLRSNNGVPPTYPLSEWGMRAVHEFKLRGSREMEEALWRFGYGTDRTQVTNYWSENPPVTISDPDENKWLLVARPDDKRVFLVVQTWNKRETEVTLDLDFNRLGFTPAAKARDVVADTEVPFSGASLKLKLSAPYGTRVIILGEVEPER